MSRGVKGAIAVAVVSAVSVLAASVSAFDAAVTRSWSTSSSFVEAPKPLVVGHRGARVAGIAENTMKAFEYALKHGADGIETDLQTSKDGYVVLFHDQLLGNRPIAAYSYAQLRRKGVQRWLPVLKWARQHGLSGHWELKTELWTDRQVQHVCSMVQAHGMAAKSTMITGRRGSLEQLSRLCPELRRGFISFGALLPPDQARALAPVYMPPVARLTSGSSQGEAYRATGLDLHVWTIRSREAYLKAVDAGASTVICDDVARCRIWGS